MSEKNKAFWCSMYVVKLGEHFTHDDKLPGAGCLYLQ